MAQYVLGQLLQQSNNITKITLQKYKGMWQNYRLYKVPCQLVYEKEEDEDRRVCPARKCYSAFAKKRMK
jgi:hypothetical protein